MYAEQRLIDNGLGFDFQQVGGMAGSFIAKTGTSMAISSLTSGAAAGSMGALVGSAAGPIGAVVGMIVSFIISMFGPDPKKPVFGLTIITPEGLKPTVGQTIGYLFKPMFDLQEGWGLKKDAQTQANLNIQAKLRIPPPGAIVLESGGLPEAVKAAKKLNFGAISEKTAQLGAPFREVLERITDPAIKESLFNAVLPFNQDKSYYYNLDKQKNPRAKLLGPEFDQYKLSGGQNLQKGLDNGFMKIANALNEAFIAAVGVNISAGGLIVDGAKAEKAFKPVAPPSPVTAVSNAVANIPGPVGDVLEAIVPTSGIGWAILIGTVLLLKR